MRFYQLHTHKDGGNSNGFRWFTTRRDAEQARAADAADDPNEGPGTITAVNVTPTKAGILQALRSYADHPDNG